MVKKARGKGRPFPKGVSGNPGGVSKNDKEFKELAKSSATKALERLISLIDSENAVVARAAACDVLDRGYGRPSTPVTGGDGGPMVITLTKTEQAL